MNTIYIEAFSGISGDMFVSAMLDLMGESDFLLKQLGTLPMQDEFDIEITKRQKNGIEGTAFNVIVKEHHHHDHGHHHHHGRNFADICHILDHSGLTEGAKALAQKIFCNLAEAEARVHGKLVEEVHFHEVGAVDSIVDIAAAAICLDFLKIEAVYCTPLSEGTGFVECEHGVIPVPVPATLQLSKNHGIPLKITQTQGEMITPTGIAILSALPAIYKAPDLYTAKTIGVGTGRKDFVHPNILRISLLDTSMVSEDSIMVIETCVDDMTGEELGAAMEKILAIDVSDIYFTQIQMKKNRPGTKITVLCEKKLLETAIDMLFLHTTTIGLRVYECERRIMQREIIEKQTPYGSMRYKQCVYRDIVKGSFEYEDLLKASRKTGESLQSIKKSLSDG